MNKLLIHALIFIGTALGGGLIASGRYGDEQAAKDAKGDRDFVVKYRNGNDGAFSTLGETPANPSASRKTFKEAEHAARLLMASATCQVKIFNVRTGGEVAF